MFTRIARLVAASSTLAVVCAGAGVTTIASASPAYAALPAVPARSADAFVNSIGVATHLTYTNTAYGDRALIAQRLSESGIRHIRDGWGTGSSYASTFVRDTLGPRGVRITMVQDPRNNATPLQQKDMVKRELMPVIAGVESLNEWDLQGAGWAPYARDWTIQMSNAYRSDPVTAGIPLLGPSMADTNNSLNHAAMGDLSPYVDFANSHDYPGNQYQMTDQIMDTVQRNMGVMVPGRPVIATETGFSNGTVNQPYPAMPEAQVAVVLPRLYLEHFRRGFVRSFSYELIDQFPNNEFESRFGLLRNDGSPKPSFAAIANLTRLLADPGPDFIPGSLKYALTGTDGDTRTMLLQKRDGTFWLALWQQTRVFDGTRAVDPVNRPVTLTLEQPAAAIKVFGLRDATTPSTVLTNTSGATLQSSEDVTFVQVTGAGAGTPVVAPAPVAPAPAPITPPATTTTRPLSDMTWLSASNGFGPAERNRSNGEAGANDGLTLTIAGKRFLKGIGVHSSSDVRVAVGGASTFRAHVGVDDETGGRGSVRFEVWSDGTRLLQTDVMRGRQAGREIAVDVRGRSELRLVVTDAGDGKDADHANWADTTLTWAPTTGVATPQQVSNLPWRWATNGWGPAERNRSNAGAAAGDGRTLTIAGKSFSGGIGAHASSDIRVAIAGASTFRASVGVDDETGGRGSVRFEVWADGTRLLQTDVLRGGQASRTVVVDVRGRSELRLVVTDGGDGTNYDHADWADAALA